MRPLDERLRAANPAPDPHAAMDRATYASVLQRARMLDAESSQSLRSRRLPAGRLALACLLLVAAVGGGFLWGRSQPTSLVTAGAAPTQIANAYVKARNAHDAQAALGLLSPDATVVEYPVIRDITELPAAFDYLELVAERITAVDCSYAVARPEAVSCTYVMSNRLVERAEAEPIAGTVRFIVQDQQIVRIENELDVETYDSSVLDRWFRWIEVSLGMNPIMVTRWAFHLDQATPTPRLDDLDEIEKLLDIYLSGN